MSEPPPLRPGDYAWLEYIGRYVRDHGYAITLRELGAAFGVYAKSSVHRRMTRLRAWGYIDWIDQSDRTLHLTELGKQEVAR